MSDSPGPTGSIPDFKPRSRTPMVVTAVVCLIVGVLGAVLFMKTFGPSPNKHAGNRAQPAATAKAAPAPAAPCAPPAPKSKSVAERAAEGDADAVKQLEALALGERTAEEIVALSRARVAERRKAIADVVRKIELVPKYAEERNTLKSLREFANDAEIAPDLVLALAGLPGPVGPDLLYTLGPAAWGRVAAKPLAKDTLYAKDVRSKASPALAVVLDLEQETSCDAVAKILERAKVSGDRRALRAMAPLGKKTGCGPQKRDDCWPCLHNRGNTLLKDAMKEASKRKPK
ncbi:MAG: hypothetical protein JW940_17680 [Polyangiaceae bacterium]|nr:hypothetical protein [Polyangiaceae bacterium]